VHIVQSIAKVANMAICGCAVAYLKRGWGMRFVVRTWHTLRICTSTSTKMTKTLQLKLYLGAVTFVICHALASTVCGKATIVIFSAAHFGEPGAK
tara:strand:+ start:620 stop:904 length:285 start_codon:yes stop_codon:yes gene_type:complete